MLEHRRPMITLLLAILTAVPTAQAISASVGVTGRIVTDSGVAVGGARIVLREAGAPRGGSNLAETLSDEEGRFRFPAPKALLVDVSPQPPTLTRLQLVATAPAMGLAIVELSGNTHSPLEVTLRPEARVEGTFVDAAGGPRAGVIVRVTAISSRPLPDNPGEDETLITQFLDPTITGPDGVAHLPGVPRDHFCLVQAVHPESSYEVVQLATHPAASEGPSRVDGEPTERRRPQQTGATFVCRPLPGPTLAQVQAEMLKQASAEIAIFMDDRLRQESDPQSKEILEQLAATSLLPSDSEPAATESVGGQVVEEGTDKGIAGVGVTYLRAGEPERAAHQLARRTQTDARGRFTLKTPPGDLTVRLHRDFGAPHPEFDVPEPQRWKQNIGIGPGNYATVKVVTGQQSPPVQLSANTGLTIRGQIVDGQDLPAAKALAEVSVDVFLPAEITKLPYGTGYSWSRFWVTADDQGRFEIKALPPHAKISMTVKDYSEQRVASWQHPADFDSPSPRTLEVPPIVLAETVTVMGKLLVDGRRPASGSEVQLETLDEPADATGERRQIGFGVTDAEGGFSIKRVVVGSPFTIRCNTPLTEAGVVARAATEEAFPPLKHGKDFDIGTVSLLCTSAPVEGVAVDAEGRPLANVLIEARLPDGRSCPLDYMLHVTGRDGRFQFTTLESGPVTLHAIQFPPSELLDRTPVARARMEVTAPATNVRLELVKRKR